MAQATWSSDSPAGVRWWRGLPRRQTRVLTWPVVTVFGFIAAPASRIFLKPTVTRRAAEALGVSFEYRSRPNWETYAELLRRSRAVRKDLPDLHPRHMDRHSVISVDSGLR